VLLVDVDHFKTVNDTLGHRAGDAVLVALAARLRQELRTEDVLGRWGGEEFVVLLPHTDADAAVALADRLRTAVGGTPFTVDGQTLSITISVGGASAIPGEDDLLRIADRELYAVKESGRDRVQVARSAVRPRVS
jgi:diguanylate cyclase (GGDEF)-like protein